jgi:hypothetical protein
MADPGVSRRAKNMADESVLRGSLEARNLLQWDAYRRTVYLNCTDESICKEAEMGMSGAYSGPLNHIARINDEVKEALSAGRKETSLQTSYWKQLTLGKHLSSDSQTFDAPMLSRQTGYWDSVSRPYEKRLLQDLSKAEDTLTYGQLAKHALSVCGGDTMLAVITLANFSKNLAAVERRQVNLQAIDKEMRDVYSIQNVDRLFHRLEGFADSPRQSYNKEGAIYHYFGALMAGAMWGHLASHLVGADNSGLASNGNGTSRTDSIKDNAGLKGALAGLELSGYSKHEKWSTWLLYEIATPIFGEGQALLF